MKQILNFLVFALIIAPLCLGGNFSRVHAAGSTYYISSSAGDDSNSGLSETSPWKSLDKIFIKAWSSSSFQSGDKILLRCGDTFNGQIRIKGAGTSISPITVGAYGTGAKPIVVGEVATNWSPVTGFPNIYVSNVGQGSIVGPAYENATKLTAVAWVVGDTEATYLSRFTNPGSYGPATTTDKIYLRTSTDAAPTAADRFFRSGTVTIDPNSNYIKIENLNIQRGFAGVDFYETHYTTISNLDVQDTLGIGIYSRLNDADLLVVNNSTLRTGNDGIYFLKCTNCIARSNTISTVTNNIVGIPTIGDQCGLGLESSTNSLVENNKLDNSKCGIDYFSDVGSEVRNNYLYLAGGIMPSGTNMKVHNNIISQQSTAMGGTNAVETGAGKSYIYNNTYYNTPSTGYGLMGSSVSGQVIFYNNLVHAGSHSPSLVNFGTNFLSDYNSFYTTGSKKWRDDATGTVYTTLASYQIASGKDTHSFFSNPLLVNPAGTSLQDFKLQNTSPCIDKGLDLVSSGMVPSYSDFDNVSIPQGQSPDIGAYEYTAPIAITITKAVDKSQAQSNDILIYTLTYTNGPVEASDVRIEDPIPAGTTFISASDNGASDATKVIWNLGTLPANVNKSVNFQVKLL